MLTVLTSVYYLNLDELVKIIFAILLNYNDFIGSKMVTLLKDL
jgi:hypothetical protein